MKESCKRAVHAFLCALSTSFLVACGGGGNGSGAPTGGSAPGDPGGAPAPGAPAPNAPGPASGNGSVRISGLTNHGFVTLLDNGTNPQTLAAEGTTAFPASWAASSAYAISVQSHAPGLACAVASPSSGTLAAGDVTVAVDCAPGALAVMHSFGGGSDGQQPYAGLSRDGAGNLYGTTLIGGAGRGTVFKIAPDGTESVLYAFGASPDAQYPYGGVIVDSGGNLYGTTGAGGTSGGGTVFKLAPNGPQYTEDFVYSLGAGKDGRYPYEGVVMDNAGNLYGTTFYGGQHGPSGRYGGYGTVFQLTRTGVEALPHLHDFSAGNDGSYPYASLVLDNSGNLYGTTYGGGSAGKGTVFEISAGGAKTVLYNFDAPSDGAHPYASLLLDGSGNLYGTTRDGGANGNGTVFKLSPGSGGYTGTSLYSFGASPDGAQPYAGVITDSAGNLYGTTYAGGAYGQGTVFRIALDGTETILHSFGASASDGQNPVGGLVMDAVGNLYGTTVGGGANGGGTAFRID